MARYRHKTIPLQKVLLCHGGPVKPLCSFCTTKDCEHLIEKRDVSIYGVTEKWKVAIKGSEPQIVIDCEGFST